MHDDNQDINIIPSKNNDFDKKGRFNLVTGCLMAIIVAMTAISSTLGGDASADWLKESARASDIYAWYQAKSIKQTLMEGERNLILVSESNVNMTPEQKNSIESHADKINLDIARIELEKNEILLGSKAVGKKNLVQTIGAIELKENAAKYSYASSIFSRASLFLQLSLVLAALSMMINVYKTRPLFFISMLIMSAYGAYQVFSGYLLISSISKSVGI